MGLREYFDRVVVISLDRRSDRWRRFQETFPSDWPFAAPQRFVGIEGDLVTVPPWWKQGGGAWGCLMSHARIIEDCLRDGVERVLILEDDVVFVNDVAEKAARFIGAVPDDWDQLYFGGQHLRDPRKLNDGVYECANINRTHCHAVARKFMPRMYRYILNAPDYIAHPGHHIDHRLGALQETGTVKAYAPLTWIAGQSGDHSDISGRANTTHFWETWAAVPEMTMYVILGLHATPLNEVAALLKSMGIHFGHNLRGYSAPRVEDVGLSGICERILPFPSTERTLDPDATAPLFHDWCRLILQEAANYGTSGAACYPHLCALHEDMARGWRHLKVIAVETDLQEAIDALVERSSRSSGWLRITPDAAASIQEFLHAKRHEWLSACEHVTVDPRRVRADPHGVAAELKSFLALSRVSSESIGAIDAIA
jgi:hypothetical protein